MTRKFIYLNTNGKQLEDLAYTVSEFVTVATPNSPVMTGASGTLDISLIPSAPVQKSSTLVIDRIADGDILRGEIVRPSNTSGKVVIADSNIDFENANVLGMALNDALDGEEIEVLVLGIITDAMFSIFPVNSAIFLDVTGGITDDRPESPARKFLVNIGKSLGGGEILISINPPVQLGV